MKKNILSPNVYRHHYLNMDVLLAQYVNATKAKRDGGRRPTGTTVVAVPTDTGSLVLIAGCIAGLGAGYLSWTSNSMIDNALAEISPTGVAGGFVNFVKAVSAMFYGVTYLVYYAISKSGRVASLKRGLASYPKRF